MLILTRKIGESILVGDNIRLVVLEIRGRQIRLGIEAPPDIVVLREEIAQRLSKENLRAASFNYQEVEQAVQALAFKVTQRFTVRPPRPESPSVTFESQALGRLTVSAVLPAAAPGQTALFGGIIQHHFTGGEYHKVLQPPLGPLGGRIEESDRLHLIPPELQPHRLGIERREQVDDPSPDAELSPFFHHGAALIPPFQEVLEKNRPLQVFSRHHVGQQVPDAAFRGQLLAQGQGRGHHEPGLLRNQGHGRGCQAGAAHVGVKTQFPEG